MFAKGQEIKFADDANVSRIQVLKTGKFDHPLYGEMKITDAILQNMKKNFDDNIRRVDLPVNYSHNSGGEAAGWFKDVIIEDGALYAEIEWTPEGEQKVKDKKFRYVSAEFNFDYADNETGKKHGATLLGAALTNIPFLKGMDAILSEYESLNDEAKELLRIKILDEQKKDNTMNFEDMKKAVAELSEDQKAELGKMLGYKKAAEKEDKKELAELTEAQTKIKELEGKLELAEKEKEFGILLSENRAVPAQKEAYLAGDMKAFVEKAVKINLDAKGTDKTELSDDKAGKSKDTLTSEQAQDKIIELAAAYSKEKLVNLQDAISQIRFENPDLVKVIK